MSRRHNVRKPHRKTRQTLLPYVLSAASCVAGKAVETAWGRLWPSTPPIIIQAGR